MIIPFLVNIYVVNNTRPLVLTPIPKAKHLCYSGSLTQTEALYQDFQNGLKGKLGPKLDAY